MASLRERKRQEVRRALITAAIDQFRARGLDHVSIRDVTQAANVSQATFFNYFPSKSHLLDAWVSEWLSDCVPRQQEARNPNLRQVIREHVREIARRAAEDRPLLAMIWPRIRAWRGGPSSELAAWVAAGQKGGDVRTDVPAESIASLLSAAIDAGLGEWLLQGGVDESAGALAPRLVRRLDVVLDGCRKRNERVRARAASSPSASA